jgi:hypothetical protein
VKKAVVPLNAADPGKWLSENRVLKPGIHDLRLEDPPNPEEEPRAAIITHGTREFDRAEYRVHDYPRRTIHWKIRWLWAESQFVCLPSLV